VVCVAAASELLASVSQRELKIGPFGASKHKEVAMEVLTLTPTWLAGARDTRLSFAVSSAAAWACAISFQFGTADDHSIYVFTSGDQRGKKIFSSKSSSHPVYALSSDASILTIVCDGVLLRLSTVTHGILEQRTLSGIDSTKLDRFPVISPDGRLLAVCDGEVVHIKDLMQPPLVQPDKIPSIKIVGVVMTADNNYVVKGGEQQWLAQMHNDGTFEDIAQLGENEVKQLAVSADGTRLAALSFYQGKTQHGLLEIANVNSRRRPTTTWPMSLHDSFTDWEICAMEFSATGRHAAMIFFVAESSYICVCDLENGSLRWKQLPGKMRPILARSLQGEVLIVVRTTDVWKVDLGNMDGMTIKYDLYSTIPYKMAALYAKFTETESSSLLEIASRLWNKPPRYAMWNTDTVAPVAPEEVKIECTIAHLEARYRESFGHWVLSNVGQRVCCIPEEYCSKWGVRTHSSIGQDRLALLAGDGTILVVNFQPMMEYLNHISA
jgi:WD40 repeat protein